MERQLAFYFDQTRCGACNACTVACKDWNQVNPGPANWRTQFTHETDRGFFPLAYTCNHCTDPACATACPFNAITKNQDGVVLVDRNKCAGAQTCVSACPFAMPQIAGDKQEPTPLQGWIVRHPMQKCGMCYTDRMTQGFRPACIISCVGRALDVGDVNYIRATYPDAVRLNPSDFPYAYINNTNETMPNLFIKKMPDDGGLGGMSIWKSTTYTGKS